MPVEADDAVALRHDDVQIVRHQQHAEAALGAQPADQRVELGLARIVDAAHRLVEHQHVGRADQRARQQHPLQLAAGELRQLAIAELAGADVGQHALDLLVLGPPPELHEARDGERDGAIDLEALRHVADDEARACARVVPLVGRSPGPAAPAPAWSCRRRWGRSASRSRPAAMSMSTPCRMARPDAREPQRARADERVGIVRAGSAPSSRVMVVMVRDRRGRARPAGASGRSARAQRRRLARVMAFHAPAPALAALLPGARSRTGPDLDHRTLGREPRRARRGVDGREHLVAVDLGHAAAGLAGQHQLAHLVAGVAGKEGVAALEAVHDAGRHQRIDRPVDRDRRQPLAPGGEPVEHLVGADRLVRGRRSPGTPTGAGA